MLETAVRIVVVCKCKVVSLVHVSCSTAIMMYLLLCTNAAVINNACVISFYITHDTTCCCCCCTSYYILRTPTSWMLPCCTVCTTHDNMLAYYDDDDLIVSNVQLSVSPRNTKRSIICNTSIILVHTFCTIFRVYRTFLPQQYTGMRVHSTLCTESCAGVGLFSSVRSYPWAVRLYWRPFLILVRLTARRRVSCLVFAQIW